MRRSRLTVLLTAPVLSLGLVAGCGGGAGGSSSGASSSGSSSSPSASESASASSSASSSAQGALSTGDFGTRVYDALKKAGTARFAVTVAFGAQRSTGQGEVDLSTSPPASHVTQEVAGAGRTEAILVGGKLYLKSPQFGAKYLEIDPTDKTGPGALLGSMGATADPGRVLKAMDAAAKVTAKGTEQVGGVSTTHYRVVVPRDALVKALGTDPRVAKVLPPQVAYDMWVDDQDLVRKQTGVVTVASNTVTTTTTFRDFGKPVTIKAPPSSQTTTRVPGATATTGS